MYISNEKIRDSEDFKTISAVMKKFEAIEEKNRCARVRFLDWLSERLLAWSKSVKEASDRIHSPCKIKL